MNDDKCTYNKLEDEFEDQDFCKDQKQSREILENEISEPEIMFFCKGHRKSTELLILFSNMARKHEYDKILEYNIEENDESNVKVDLVRYFYMVLLPYF